MFRLHFRIVIGTEIFGYLPGFKVKCSVSQLFLLLVLSAHECTDSELGTAYEQATITALIQNILLGRESLEER